MRFCKLSAAFRGTGKVFTIVAAVLLAVGISATKAATGDLSAEPSDSLSITGSSASVLAAARGTAAGAPAESSWLQRLHVTGYLSQQFGMWQDPPSLRSFTRSRNNLAVARTTLQVDENFQLDERNSFFMREWFTYDPAYSWNSANATIYSRPPDPKPPHSTGLSVGP